MRALLQRLGIMVRNVFHKGHREGDVRSTMVLVEPGDSSAAPSQSQTTPVDTDTSPNTLRRAKKAAKKQKKKAAHPAALRKKKKVKPGKQATIPERISMMEVAVAKIRREATEVSASPWDSHVFDLREPRSIVASSAQTQREQERKIDFSGMSHEERVAAFIALSPEEQAKQYSALQRAAQDATVHWAIANREKKSSDGAMLASDNRWR